jgi:hypothetical protein
MTTRVQVRLVQEHLPVIVEVLREDGSPARRVILEKIGDVVDEYVHSGQTLRVQEMTTQEMHARKP